MNYEIIDHSISVGMRKARCLHCHKKFDIYEYLGSYDLPGCLKCTKCKTHFLYDQNADLLKDIDIYKLPIGERIEHLEKLFNPCKLCGGDLEYVDILKRFPAECPECNSADMAVDEKKQLTNTLKDVKWIKLA